jgi:hypothetical protein
VFGYTKHYNGHPLSDKKMPTFAIGRVLPGIVAGGILALIAGCAAPSLPPVNDNLPEALRAPAGVVLEDILTAQGEVLYECARNSNQLTWVKVSRCAATKTVGMRKRSLAVMWARGKLKMLESNTSRASGRPS